MTAFMLAKALESSHKDRVLEAAFVNIVSAYFEEYTDATELDGDFESSLLAVWDVCFPSGETESGVEFEQIIRKV